MNLRLAVCMLLMLFGCGFANGQEKPDLKSKPLGELIKSMKDPAADVRRKAMEQIHSSLVQGVGRNSSELGVAVIAALKDSDETICLLANASLKLLASKIRKEAIPALLEIMKGKETAKRIMAVPTLAVIGRNDARTLPALVAVLKDKDATLRSTAVHALADLGGRAKPAAPALFELLKDNDGYVRMIAIQALSVIGTGEGLPVETLVRLLNDDELNVRYYAGELLQKLRPRLMNDLLRVLKDKDATLRGGAAAGLGLLENADKDTVVPALTRALKDPELQVRLAAADSLLTLNRDSKEAFQEALAIVKVALKDRSVEIRKRGALVLKQMAFSMTKTDRPDMTPALREAIKDPDRSVRELALQAISKIGPEAKDTIPFLIELLQDKSPAIAQQAAGALGRMGPAAKDAIPGLKTMLARPEPGFHSLALESLGALGANDSELMDAQLKALADKKNVRGRQAAALFFNQLGPKGDQAIPALVKALRDQDHVVRQRAASALRRQEKKAVPHLLMIVDDPDTFVRATAIGALARIGPDSARGLRVLIAALGDQDEVVRRHGSMGLSQIGPGLIPEITKLLRDESSKVRRQTAVLLTRFGSAAKEALPALIELLQDKDRGVAVSAAGAVWSLKGDGEKAKPSLVRGLAAEDANVRWEAAHYLGQMGATAKSCVPALLAAAKDQDVSVRQAALQALKQIDPQAAKEAIK